MIVAVLRTRLNPEAREEYQKWAARMSLLASEIPDYVAHKSYTADDGERVTIAEFASEAGMRTWATHPEHVAAKKLGRDLFFTEYRVQICNVVRDSADKKIAASA